MECFALDSLWFLVLGEVEDEGEEGVGEELGGEGGWGGEVGEAPEGGDLEFGVGEEDGVKPINNPTPTQLPHNPLPLINSQNLPQKTNRLLHKFPFTRVQKTDH